MDGGRNIHEITGALQEHVQQICGKRRRELQDDEALLKGVIDRLNLHSCSANNDPTAGWPEKEETINAYQKAREERDEYKFQLNVYKMKIKDLKEELKAARLNQTQHNISIVADLSRDSERKSCAYSLSLQPDDSSSNKNVARLSTVQSTSEETYRRELDYLHKTNEKYYEEIRKLRSELMSQEALMKKLNDYEGEVTKLKKIIEEKQEKMMNMQIEFDEKFKNSKRELTAHISVLNNRIRELETVRDDLNIDLGAAQEELRLLKLSSNKPIEEAAVHSNSVEFPYKAVTNLEQKKETSHVKEELTNVNTRKERRCRLQPIENIIEHEHSTITTMSEESVTEDQQDEVMDLVHGVTRGTKRGQRGGKGLKKESAASQKQGTKKMKASDEKNTDQLQNIKNELTDASSSNVRKGNRTRTVVIPRNMVTDSSKDAAVTNKKNKKLKAKLEKDENMEPSHLECSSSSLNGTLENIKPAEGTTTPVTKVLKKVQDDGNKRTNRRKNK